MALALWGETGDLDDAVDALRRAAEGNDDPVLWFRLGVALRMRYDSVHKESGETVVIPPAPQPGTTARVHLILTPNSSLDAHWNNEASHSELWIDPPPGWSVDQNHQHLEIGAEDVSDETRHLEFEVAVPNSAERGGTLSGYLLYYACEGASGVCVYRRQNLHIPITTDQEAVGLAG